MAIEFFPLLGRAIRAIPLERLFLPPRNPQEEYKKYIEAERVEAPARPPDKIPPVSAAKRSENVAEATSEKQEIATACVPCALGHFSRSAGALEEAKRFQHEGITSNEILDRIADVLKEQNTLERYDLTPMKLQNSPEWERELAEEALEESRQLRHLLEGFTDMKQLETAAARAATFYKRLNREWFKRRLAQRGSTADNDNVIVIEGPD